MLARTPFALTVDLAVRRKAGVLGKKRSRVVTRLVPHPEDGGLHPEGGTLSQMSADSYF